MKKIVLAVTALISVGILSVFLIVAGGNAALPNAAIKLWGETGTGIGLNWQNFDVPDLARVRILSNDLLSYDLQVKVKILQNFSADEHYLAGLSFRFDTVASGINEIGFSDDNFYGISFFRSSYNSITGMEICHKPDTPAEKTMSIPECAWEAHLEHGDTLGACSGDSGGGTITLPQWVEDLKLVHNTDTESPYFDDILDGKPYLILWAKVGENFELLDYKELVEADGVIAKISSGGDDNGNDNGDQCNVNDNYVFDTEGIRDWSTIMVRVEEVKTGPSTTKNRITAYIQGTESLGPDLPSLPRNTVSWNDERFNKVDWSNAGPETIDDATLTSFVFVSKNPAELGIHGFHSGNTDSSDPTRHNAQFFCDIDVKLANIIEIIQE